MTPGSGFTTREFAISLVNKSAERYENYLKTMSYVKEKARNEQIEAFKEGMRAAIAHMHAMNIFSFLEDKE